MTVNKSLNEYLPWVACIFLSVEIVAINLLLPLPDSNDFYELSRICRLIDFNVLYCVNNNWGFAHPLLCWFATKATGDLFVAQRLIDGVAMIASVIISYTAFVKENTKKSGVFFPVAVLLLLSPWAIDLMISVHMDIVPVLLVITGIAIAFSSKRWYQVLFAALLVGCAYWFRFHFLLFALLFPVVVAIVKKQEGRWYRTFLCAVSGCAFALAVPHLLCYVAYGVFSISNEKFVFAQAVGITDWSLEFAKKLDMMSTVDLLGMVDVKVFVARFCYRFLKSGMFPFFVICLVFILNHIKTAKKTNDKIADSNNRSFQCILIALYAFTAILPFTVLRGFTCRLEAACIMFVVPLLLYSTSGQSRVSRPILLIFLATVLIHGYFYGKEFARNRSSLMHIQKTVAAYIPEYTLRQQPASVLNCVDYYNPYNCYRLCNPMVFSGWGVRFAPLPSHFGYVNLEKPFDNDLYKNAHYLILPASTEYFTYAPDLVTKNSIVYKDATLIILSK